MATAGAVTAATAHTHGVRTDAVCLDRLAGKAVPPAVPIMGTRNNVGVDGGVLVAGERLREPRCVARSIETIEVRRVQVVTLIECFDHGRV